MKNLIYPLKNTILETSLKLKIQRAIRKLMEEKFELLIEKYNVEDLA